MSNKKTFYSPCRYLIQIQFKREYSRFPLWDIEEQVKSIIEIMEYKQMLDDTVDHAQFTDLISGKIEILK